MPTVSSPLTIRDAASMPASEVLAALDTTDAGLTRPAVAERFARIGPNAVHQHRARAWLVLGRQLRSPILILLFLTAGVSLFLGEQTNAIIIGVILTVSVGLGFSSEFRAALAADALHDTVRHTAIVRRDGAEKAVEVSELVPGDIVQLGLGDIVPADLRLLAVDELRCDEAVLTGESLPAGKSSSPAPTGAVVGDLTSCALMGTVVHAGTGIGVVVATGARAEFGRIALQLGDSPPQTSFQKGLQRFSLLLLQVAVALTTTIFAINIVLQRPLLDSLLFSLAIAVGITPQLLPAVVNASLAAGSRALARRKVLVKRLVCIEDLGDVDLLVTDKTGTLTDGRIAYVSAVPVDGATSETELLRWGLLATEADLSRGAALPLGLNALDEALWHAPASAALSLAGHHRIALIPFDHDRRRVSALIEHDGGRMVVSKGSPDDVLELCVDVPDEARATLQQLYGRGARVVAVAVRDAAGLSQLTVAEERGFTLLGYVTFADEAKADARESLERLSSLGIAVKIATGDNALVAETVLAAVGLPSGGTLDGAAIEVMSDDELASAAATATIFARVSPEQKARIVRLLRRSGRSVAFLGDGVNDALALHAADVGISVDSGADIAKDAADVVLLEKDLGVLADGVIEGRRIFANTMKYVLMGTSSNFGNMASASVASVVLPFLPMLPGQILLNNLLYDAGQLAIPGDRVDAEQLTAPSHWDIAHIRRFMLVFGPISSLFDFATFALMILVFQAAEGEFQAGWFIESIATQSLIILAIRTRRVPFFFSRPSPGLLLATLAVVAIGVWLPFSPVAGVLGFEPLPAPFFLALIGMIVIYLVLVESAKHRFFSRPTRPAMAGVVRRRGREHRVARRSRRFVAPSPHIARTRINRRR